jgi:hypothetical protein
MRKAYDKHVSLWNTASKDFRDYADRIPPLNILAVLGYEVTFRSWDISKDNLNLTSSLLSEIDSVILPAQEEVAVLVGNSEYKSEYSADVFIDLAKMHAFKYLLLRGSNLGMANDEFSEIVVNLNKAKTSIRNIDQLTALRKSLDIESVYLRIELSKRNELKKLLS